MVLIQEQKYYMINFDFDTNKLKELCGENDYRKIYRDIERELKPYFSHDQWSRYVTKEKTTELEVVNNIAILAQKFPLEISCLKKIYLTESIGRHDITSNVISIAKKELKKSEKSKKNKKAISTIKKNVTRNYDFER